MIPIFEIFLIYGNHGFAKVKMTPTTGVIPVPAFAGINSSGTLETA